MRIGNDGTRFLSNHAGGILGGISTGQPIVARFAVKPTSSILSPRQTVDRSGHDTDIMTKGRHDPCVGIRAVPVGEAMMACVLADHFLRHRGQSAAKSAAAHFPREPARRSSSDHYQDRHVPPHACWISLARRLLAPLRAPTHRRLRRGRSARAIRRSTACRSVPTIPACSATPAAASMHRSCRRFAPTRRWRHRRRNRCLDPSHRRSGPACLTPRSVSSAPTRLTASAPVRRHGRRDVSHFTGICRGC